MGIQLFLVEEVYISFALILVFFYLHGQMIEGRGTCCLLFCRLFSGSVKRRFHNDCERVGDAGSWHEWLELVASKIISLLIKWFFSENLSKIDRRKNLRVTWCLVVAVKADVKISLTTVAETGLAAKIWHYFVFLGWDIS